MNILYFLAQVSMIAAVVFSVEAIFRKKIFKKVRVALIKRKIRKDAIKSMKLVWHTDVIFTQWRKDICDAQNELAEVIYSGESTVKESKEKLSEVLQVLEKYTELSDIINLSISSEQRDKMYKPFADRLGIEIGGEASQ